MYKSPSEILSRMDGHGIYDVSILDELSPEHKAMVPTFSQKHTAAIMDNRGLGGTLTDDTDAMLVFGYTTASAFASNLAGQTSVKMGRGSSFRDNVQFVREAGF